MQEGGCQKQTSGRKRPFVIAAYVVVDGQVSVELPDTCPFCDDGKRCSVGRHAKRERKTGPGHALVVARCHKHERYFTLYPRGYVPYARQPIVDVEDNDEPAFRAARDAADDDTLAWRRRRRGAGGAPCWRTQCRHIRRVALMLGISASEATAEACQQALDVSLSSYREAYMQFHAGGYRERGRAVVRVLDEIDERPRQRLRRILWSSYIAGVYGRAWRCKGGKLSPLFPAREASRA